MNILFIGDIFGRPGRDLVRRGLPPLVHRYAIDFVVANVENAAGGFGITREVGDSLAASGIDVMTSGNHVWDKKESLDYVAAEPRLLRPANYPAGVPGRGSVLARTSTGLGVGVINLMGRVFMHPLDDPFAAALREAETFAGRTRIILVDFHAEATSEKIAMGWHLDGRVTAVIGTHTHVQTADEQIRPNGTAYITDAGMTGPHASIIGTERQPALARFLTGMPSRFEPATGDPRLNGVVIAVDDEAPMRLIRLFNEGLGRKALAAAGVPGEIAGRLDLLGISGLGNLIAAVKFAKYLELTASDWVVTVATDSMDLYRSRLTELTQERGDYRERDADRDMELLAGIPIDHMKELTYYEKKAIHNLKYFTWVEQQGRDVAELRAQWHDHARYWDGTFALADRIDELITDFNQRVGLVRS